MADPASLQRILYVEDDPDIQAVARLALEAVGGFTVALCGSGREALETAETFAPDLLLLDVMMPELDGPATLQALRRRPALAEVPAIYMTAKTHPRDLARLRAQGAIDIITKPFDPMRLPGQLREIWNRL